MKERNGEFERGRGGDQDADASDLPTLPVAQSPTLPLAASPTRAVDHSDLRILLWDIDGTLIHSLRIGAYKEYTIPVLEEVFGTSGRLANMRVSGMTDLQIIAEALRDEGFSHHDIREQIHHLSEKLTAEAKKVTGNGEPFFEVLPGVKETLEVLSNHPRYRSALVTGNIEPMAQLKMELVGLDRFFTLPGAFGDESHQRRDLPERAAQRINNFLQTDLQPKQFIVIGDTPNDIDCAHHFGARAVAVGTGRFYSRDELLACKPDAWLQDLSDPELVLTALAEL
ncbi:MAG TPA: HAD hydrolase-like protein [Pyrinomonadaceae bacterium]|jgi:phosphoglycolate phosphatase-like HAD superfamily hydrolase